MKSNVKFILITSLIFIVVVSFFYYQIKNTEIDCSFYYEKTKQSVFKGIVNGKYIDTRNHNYRIFLLHHENSTDTFAWESDLSNFYKDLEVGDSVFKEKNSLKIIIKKRHRKKEYLVDFGCN